MENLPAVYIIFTLLNAIRRGIPRAHIWREFRRQGIRMHPRLSFWIALCRQAGLLREHCGAPHITAFASQWMDMPPDAQALHLLQAWQNAPKHKGERCFRHKLVWKLQWDKPLTETDRRALNGLESLGFCQGQQLTSWGVLLIKGEGNSPTPKPERPWQVEGESPDFI